MATTKRNDDRLPAVRSRAQVVPEGRLPLTELTFDRAGAASPFGDDLALPAADLRTDLRAPAPRRGAAAPVTSARSAPTVGFDLDMTLIDSRPGIAAVLRALSAETGVDIDADAAVDRLGPPLNDELARWFPAEQVEAMADRYRALYPSLAIEPVPLLPGAADAIAAVHAAGGKVVVITSKAAWNAALHLEHLGVRADELEGWAFGDGKRDALRKHGVAVYVGDYTADMLAAKAAGDVVAVGVPTGPCSEAELVAAGADVVLPDLGAFPCVVDRFSRLIETTWAASPPVASLDVASDMIFRAMINVDGVVRCRRAE